MPISYSNGESGLSVRNKINSGFGVESGALADPYELAFSVYHRIRTLTVDEDIELSIASGAISHTFEELIVTGDESHLLTFPTDWVVYGDQFNPYKIQRVILYYDGTYVEAVIKDLGLIPDVIAPTLTSATMTGATTQTLDLVFDEAVDITTAGWSVSASGGAVTVSSVSSGSGTTTPKFTLSRSIGAGETLTVSYDPSTGATIDDDGNELETVSAQSVTNNALTINLEVLFTGTTVDTSKGTVTNPDSANLTISQNGKLIFTRTTDVAVASVLGNYWRSVNTYTRGVFAVLANRDSGYTNSFPCFMYRVDATNYIAFIGTSTPGVWEIRVVIANATVYTSTTAISTSNRVRIVYTSGNVINFEYWNGSAWTLMGTYTGNVGSAGTIQLSSNSSTADAPTNAFSFDSLYVTDNTYTSVTP